MVFDNDEDLRQFISKNRDIIDGSIKDGNITFEGKNTVENVIDTFVKNSDLNWKFENGEFRIINTGFDTAKKGGNTKKRSGAKALRSITAHASGIDGNTVYVNDFDSDYDYLTGLNYAEIRSTSIPSGNSTGYYDDEYIVSRGAIDDKGSFFSILEAMNSPLRQETSHSEESDP